MSDSDLEKKTSESLIPTEVSPAPYAGEALPGRHAQAPDPARGFLPTETPGMPQAPSHSAPQPQPHYGQPQYDQAPYGQPQYAQQHPQVQYAPQPGVYQTMPGAPMPNITIVNHNTQSVSAVTPGNQKSMVTAMLLTLFFGPLGMLYSTVVGAIVTFVIGLALVVPSGGIIFLLMWPVQLVWTYIGVKNHNARSYVRAA